MPWFIQCFKPAVAATNDLLTWTAFDTEQFFIVLSTIRLATVKVETLVGYLLATLSANEVLRMEHFTNSFYTWLLKSWKTNISIIIIIKFVTNVYSDTDIHNMLRDKVRDWDEELSSQLLIPNFL